jgi:DNA polymerase
MDAVVAVDFEAEYGSDLNLKRQGPVVYAGLTHIFLVGIYTPGLEYIGPPQDAPWDQISGEHWVSHNAGFDQVVFQAASRRGLISAIAPSKWSCTADLSAFVGIGRKLSEAVKNSFGVEISKSIRQRAGNRIWPSGFNAKMQEDFKTYCLADAKWCYELWMKWCDAWLPEEREFSEIIRRRSHAGIAVDQEKLTQVKSILKLRVREAREQIPWDDPPLSRARLVNWCEKEGVVPPDSTAEKNEAFARWVEAYGAKFPQIFWVGKYRKANRRLELCEAIERRIMPDGRMNFTLKYHGAGNTGRLSGSDGLNMQNLNKDGDGGVDLRSIFVAAPGKTLVIADFAQIEPRVVAWVCKDSGLLKLLHEGMNFYEVDAKIAKVWDAESGTLKKSNPKLYQLQKAQTLGIGYGMGAKRFVEAARTMLNLEFSEAEAKGVIAKWHARYPSVKPVWNQLERGLTRAFNLGESFGIKLPSERELRYYDLKREFGGITGATTRGSVRRMKYWGGVLFENVIQAIARDVLRDAILRLEAAGIPVIFSSHDECVCEVDPSFPKEEVVRIMTIPPIWAPDLPLAAEATASRHYLK